MRKPTNKSFAETLPDAFRRACSCMSSDGGFRAWLDEKFGAGKWALCHYPTGSVEIALDNNTYGDLAVEYGYHRLTRIFASLDPVSAAALPSGSEGK